MSRKSKTKPLDKTLRKKYQKALEDSVYKEQLIKPVTPKATPDIFSFKQPPITGAIKDALYTAKHNFDMFHELEQALTEMLLASLVPIEMLVSRLPDTSTLSETFQQKFNELQKDYDNLVASCKDMAEALKGLRRDIQAKSQVEMTTRVRDLYVTNMTDAYEQINNTITQVIHPECTRVAKEYVNTLQAVSKEEEVEKVDE